MAYKTTEKMMWYNEGGLESKADDELKQEVLRSLQAEWARINVSGELDVEGLRGYFKNQEASPN